MRSYEKAKTSQILFGVDAARQTGEKLKSLGVTKCFVVTDKGVVSAGLVQPILDNLKAEGLEYIIFDKVEANPPDYICLEAAAMLKETKCDATLAIGGGSSLDTGKVASFLANIPGEIEDLYEFVTAPKVKPTDVRAVKLVTMPTTSGSGAEGTGSVVITDLKRGAKYIFMNENLRADMCIVDPALTVGMPPKSTVICGVDAFTHAIEKLVGTDQNDFLELILLECAAKIWKWLPIAVKEPDNIEARSQLSWAAHNTLCNGGKANGHAVAHAMGALYHITHGHACIITLPAVIRHHSQTSAEAILKIAQTLGIPTTENSDIIAKRFADEIVDFYKTLGLSSFKEAMLAHGGDDNMESFMKKMTPLILDDPFSKVWQPAIHKESDRPVLTNILEMIYMQD